MADLFGASATELSAPQGQGATPVAPVEQRAVNTSYLNSSVLTNIVDVFAKGLAQNAKEEEAARKAAIMAEYINNEKVYNDAYTSGQWNASHVSAASKANYFKMLAAYPGYTQEIVQARAAVYGGTEIGSAEKVVDAQTQMRNHTLTQAVNRGFTMFDGMSKESEDRIIDASQAEIRSEKMFDQYAKTQAELRAQSGEMRAQQSHAIQMEDHVAKKESTRLVLDIAKTNFDAFESMGRDLQHLVSTGKMSPEEAMQHLNTMTFRVKGGIDTVTAANPQLAEPWKKLFQEMYDVNMKLLDPTKLSQDARSVAENKYAELIARKKMMAVQDNPKLLKAVVGTALFPGEGMLTIANNSTVTEWIMSGLGIDSTLKKPKNIVGTEDDKEAFKAIKTQLGKLQSGGLVEKEQANKEAVSLVNQALSDTASVDGTIAPQSLKAASAFYASTEFGKFAKEGNVDKVTASNVQRVFLQQYDPAVKQAILDKLNKPADPLAVGDAAKPTLMEQVDIKLVGSNVSFTWKSPTITSARDALKNADGEWNRQQVIRDLRDAEAGLNQLIRMHAHLEGTTDYAAYWDKKFKYEVFPGIYGANPNPDKPKPAAPTTKTVTAKAGNNWWEQ